MAIRGNRIVAVGSTADVMALCGPATRVVDAAGASVLPGFIESHLHIFPGGASLTRLQLDGVHGAERLAAVARAWAAGHPDDRLIYGIMASYQILGDPPTRQRLDQVLPDRPFAIHAFDGHTVWANTQALELAGLLHGRSLPPGNEIVMGADGTATGELREPAAYTPVMALLPSGGREKLGITTGRDPDPPPTPAQRAADRATIEAGLAWCARHGITSIHNMDGNPYQLGLLAELDDAGQLALPHPPALPLQARHAAGRAARGRLRHARPRPPRPPHQRLRQDVRRRRARFDHGLRAGRLHRPARQSRPAAVHAR